MVLAISFPFKRYARSKNISFDGTCDNKGRRSHRFVTPRFDHANESMFFTRGLLPLWWFLQFSVGSLKQKCLEDCSINRFSVNFKGLCIDGSTWLVKSNHVYCILSLSTDRFVMKVDCCIRYAYVIPSRTQFLWVNSKGRRVFLETTLDLRRRR